MSAKGWRRLWLGLALVALAACGVKGDPVAPEPPAEEQAR